MVDLTLEKQNLFALRIALLVEYNGSAFSGSQLQLGQETIQSAIEAGFKALNIPSSRVMFSGRTDAGVNARGQVAHVNVATDALKNIPCLTKSLNAVLPNGIAIKEVCLETNVGFHSQLSATHRWYRYTIFNHPTRSPLMPVDACWISKPLNAEMMQTAAQQLLGTHNFKSFKCPDTPIQNDICHIMHINLERQGDLITLDIVADRFLYKMVRNLVGFLIEIGREQPKLTPEDLLKALSKQDRTQAGPTAKPNGLSLMAVAYPAAHQYFSRDRYGSQLNQLIMESMQDENLFRKAS